MAKLATWLAILPVSDSGSDASAITERPFPGYHSVVCVLGLNCDWQGQFRRSPRRSDAERLERHESVFGMVEQGPLFRAWLPCVSVGKGRERPTTS
ncbi:hypothetical protein B0T16DRAFT_130775 [Cercophora newfieldiana]|uniref:Secreted protein n=1 Tax=Cercophora newfieldiana TaxID=92897 RepID=A0AA39YEA3_9PEZI|nr:hypothetical protein B0T16DRAFT_130775 [Cercophora newfieldiana]